MRSLALLALISASATASAQCYQFSASGATLRVNITAVILQAGPIRSNGGSVTGFTFSGDNSFTVGSSTLTSQDVANGTASIQYVPSAAPGVPDNTGFAIAVPNADPNFAGPGEHSWAAYLAGTGDLIPTRLLPPTLPPFSAWTGIAGSNYIEVSSGSAKTQYPITAVSACAASMGNGNGGSPQINGVTLGNPSHLPGDCACGGPINAGNGNLFEQFTDYQTYGPNTLSFTRYYNSLDSGNTFAAWLGPNWRSNYDRYLRIGSSTSVIAERPDGQQVTFTLNGGAWTTDTDVDIKLTNTGSTWTLTDHDDTVETYTVTVAGEALLQTIQARNGYTQTLQYGDNNQLLAVADSFQRTLAFGYQNNRLHIVSTPDSSTISYNYVSGQLSYVGYSTTPPAIQTYLYENASLPNALTGIVDEDNNRYATWTYDSSGRALTSQRASGAGLTTVAYNDTDGSRTVTNALGVQQVYKFTTLQGVPKLTEADRLATSSTAAATSAYTYDANGFTASSTDPNGNVTNYVNDAHGQPTIITEAAGTAQARTTTIAYHSTFHLPLQTVTAGLTTSFTYDAAGQMLTKTQTDTTSNTSPYSTAGRARTWSYIWSNFQIIATRSPRSDVSAITKFTYDSNGALTTIANALNQTTQITQHLPGGLPLTVVDSNGVATNYTYDARQRLLSIAVNGTGQVFTTNYNYDAAGNSVSTTLPDGSSIMRAYDAAHRLTTVTDKLGNSISFGLDALGDRNQTLILDPSGILQLKRTAIFDALGRVQQETGGANQITSYTYDANGNRLTVTDPLNHVTQQSFDELNRVVKTTNQIQGATSVSYDAQNRPLRITDLNGAATSYLYDGFGDLIQLVSPSAGAVTYRYDASGNLTQSIDARGVEADFAYDALDRLISTAYPGDPVENVSYRYDEPGHTFGVGRLTSVTDAAGTLSRAYDERGNLTGESRAHGAATLTTTYAYDDASRLSAIKYPSQWSVAYARDVMGRETAAVAQAPTGGTPKPIFSSAAYQPFGSVSAITYGNGIAEFRGFDRGYRLTRIVSASVQNLTYGYDAADNVLSLLDSLNPAHSQSFGYDVLNRLTSASGPYGNLAYTYDGNGNRLTETSAATAQDGLGSITALTYNQANRLATVSAGPQQLTQYTYDAFGRRTVKLGSATATTLYQYDRAGHLLEETDAQGSARVDYIYLDDRPIATIQPANGKFYFLHDDRLGTPQMATDSTQAIAWSTTYQPFGQIASAPTTITENLRLPGQEFDLETGLNHNGFRDYAPALGRYLTSDPIGLAGGLNAYAYASNNPLISIDPLGLSGLRVGQVPDLPSAFSRRYAGRSQAQACTTKP